MARSDLLLNLVKAGTVGDQTLFLRTVEALVAEERDKQHHVLADRLSQFLEAQAPKPAHLRPATDESLFLNVMPEKGLDDLILTPDTKQACTELLEEHQRRDLLASFNLEPRHKILLTGPPGNGKTSLAEALASTLMLPFFVVRYESVIGSYLGETANRLSKLFQMVRTHSCVLFFDEFDVVGKERGDTHETGEIKRVVSSLLMQIDRLSSHVVVVAATNHEELLDRAAGRRFQLRLSLPAPSQHQRARWFDQFATELMAKSGYSSLALARRFNSSSFADLELFALDVKRRVALEHPDPDWKRIVTDRLPSPRQRPKKAR